MKTLLVLLGATGLASTAWAEPMFLSKQHTRCMACHYSPTGGGLLTPYGRLLSHRELSTTGATSASPAAGAEDDPHGEQAFLYGALGNALGPVHLGLEMRPAHLVACPFTEDAGTPRVVKEAIEFRELRDRFAERLRPFAR